MALNDLDVYIFVTIITALVTLGEFYKNKITLMFSRKFYVVL